MGAPQPIPAVLGTPATGCRPGADLQNRPHEFRAKLVEALLFFLFLDTEASHHFVVPVLIFVLGRGVEISCELMMKAPIILSFESLPRLGNNNGRLWDALD